MSTIIYCFTATGNSLFVAKEIEKAIGGSCIVPIVKDSDEKYTEASAHTIGFVFPLYHGGMPKIVDNFLRRMKIKGNPYIFAVATGGEGGIIEHQISKILEEKDCSLDYLTYINMPNNYIRHHDIKSPSENERCIIKSKEDIKKISKDIYMKKNYFCKEKKALNILRFPIYNIWKSSSARRDEKFNASELCSSCGICVKVCPANNIILDDGHPKWMHKCEDCMCCINMCPEVAINIGKSTLRRRRYRNPYISLEEIIRQKKNGLTNNKK